MSLHQARTRIAEGIAAAGLAALSLPFAISYVIITATYHVVRIIRPPEEDLHE